MKKSFFFVLVLMLSTALHAQHVFQNLEGKCSRRPVADRKLGFSGYKQSNLLNDYDVHFYFLDINLERTSTYVSGNVAVHATVTASQLDTFALELIDDLTVDSVFINGAAKSFVHSGDHIYIPAGTPVAGGSNLIARVYYHGTPSTGGSFFSGISNDNSPSWGNQVTWTLSEPFNANQWWPCKQVLPDKADSCWVFITTSDQNKAGSNGLLSAQVSVPGNKTRFEWKTKYPMAYYLVSASVAEYVDYTLWAYPDGTTDSVMIQNFVYDNPATLPYFQSEIDQTADFIELYSDLFGLYPFIHEKYGHCMAPMGGGMEHQTMTTLGYFNFYLVCHELAHMWFGDNVTCATWSDIWINEGFASYGEYLAAQYLDSYSEAQSHMLDVHNNVMSETGGSVYVPPAETNDENRIFDGRLSYDKGSAIIHMIRFEMQDDSLFFATLQYFQDEFGDSTATGPDFRETAETVSGLDLTDFFDQWYFGEGYPTYHVEWYVFNDSLHFTTIQTTSSPVTSVFKMLMEYRVNTTSGDTMIRFYQDANVCQFHIPMNKTVTGMEVDPDNWVLDGPSTVVASTQEATAESIYSFGPNPCHNYVQLFPATGTTGPLLSEILDMTGRVVFSGSASGNTRIDVSGLEAGIYILKVSGSGQTRSSRLLKY